MTSILQTALHFSFRIIAAAVIAGIFASCGPAPEDNKSDAKQDLPQLGTILSETSVSGISSGAYMAGQFQLAHGDLVIGAAIIAGGPYGCAESTFADVIPGPGTAFLNLSKAVNGCMRNSLQAWGVPDPVTLAKRARERAEKGRITPLATVLPDKVYLFSGLSDKTVAPNIVKAAHAFYRELGMPAANLKLLSDSEAGHAFVTENEGAECQKSSSPYVVDCDYDQAGDLLTHIYGPLAPRTQKPEGEFLRFDQRPFTKGLGDHGLAVTGAVYVPKECHANACRVHIAFHGCAQSRQFVGTQFIEDTGFAQWADTNRLVVLFPQTTISPVNPQGCWDWWGFTSNDYLTQKAPQIISIHRMLKHLAQNKN